MKKIVTVVLLLLINISTIRSQDIKTAIPVVNGLSLTKYGFTKNGNFYIHSKDNKMKFAKKSNSFTTYTTDNLEIGYTMDFKGLYEIRKISNTANGLILHKGIISYGQRNNYNVLLAPGTLTEFTEEDWNPKNFVMMSSQMSDAYYVASGYEERKDKASKEKKRFQKLSIRNLSDFTHQYVDLKFPEGINRNASLQVFRCEKDHFKVVFKEFKFSDDKKGNSKSQKYSLVSYSYAGEILNSISFCTEIKDENLLFYKANLGGNSYNEFVRSYFNTKGELRYKTVYNWEPSALGDILVDEKNQVYYTYAIIASKNNKYGAGYLIHKFDFAGNLIWKQENKIFEHRKKVKVSGHGTNVYLVNAGKSLGFMIRNYEEEYLKFLELDKDTGNPIRHESFKKVKKLNVSIFKDKDLYKKYTLDQKSVLAYFLNDEFRRYINALPKAKREVHFSSWIGKSKVLVAKHDDKENSFELLKFTSQK